MCNRAPSVVGHGNLVPHAGIAVGFLPAEGNNGDDGALRGRGHDHPGRATPTNKYTVQMCSIQVKISHCVVLKNSVVSTQLTLMVESMGFCDQQRNECMQERLASLSDIVHNLEETEVQRELLL